MSRLGVQCMTYQKEGRMEQGPKLRILSICHPPSSMLLSLLGCLGNMGFLQKRWWLFLVIICLIAYVIIFVMC